jgi:DNA-binding NtrC family response regulator
VTTELLRDIGSQAVTVRDGNTALAVLEHDPTIGLVIADIVMPGGMSGVDLARALRKHRPELPVLLATGYSQYTVQVMDDGFALIEKPYRRDALAASIRAAVGHGRDAERVAKPVVLPSPPAA